jgi:cobalt/nickel transport system permease protein
VHIPDGYLSPSTCAAFGAVMVPLWYRATHRIRKIVKSRSVPLVALGAAFSFLIMMFNVPIPDGTTAHAVGAVLIAVLLGPWAAVIAVSIALAIQALFFGDGGVLAYGTNAFNMAVVMPFVGYAAYRILARGVSLTGGRRALAAGIGGYLGLNASALAAAIEFGVQPALFHSANGTPLYAPFHLSQTIPTMAFAHLTVAGLVEFAVTAGVVAYLQRANVPVLRLNHPNVPVTDEELGRQKHFGWRWALVGMGILALLTPLGLLAPGGAFGESAPGDLVGRYGLKAVPSGLNRFSRFWSHHLLGGYGFENGQHQVIGYLVSAVAGVLVIGLVVLAIAAIPFLRGRISRWRARTRARSARPASRAAPAAVVASSAAATVHHHHAGQGATPAWLVHGEVGLCACGCVGRRKKGNFVEKTLNGASGLLRQVMFSEDVALRRGFLQRLDPRVKILGLLGLLVTAALVRHIPVLLAMYAVTLGLAVVSGLPLGFFVKRVWLFIPVFTGIVVLPATFSFITHGHIVWTLWHWHGHAVGITSQGLESAGLIVSRVATSISLVVLLTLTTPWVKLLAALRALLVPRIFILIIGMAYRYLFLLLNSVTDMFTARKARSVGNAQIDTHEGRRFVSATAGALFGKAHALSEEVHQAMVSRGYTGNAKALSRFRVRALDWAFAASVVLAGLLVLGGDRYLGR